MESIRDEKPEPVEAKKEEKDEPQVQEAKVEDAEQDAEDLDADTEIVTMVDVLQEENELEDNADAVLGGSDDSKCTHSDEKAFRRQALYACKTCADETSIWQAGICLACSYVCHDGHDLYELYTKRAFKCDCGIESKFPGKKCSLIPDKDPSGNTNNNYNQNFQGKYCTCERPYPDPEDKTDDEMIQCVACEDWFHHRHLVGNAPDDDYSEIICHKCMSRLPFLWYYYPRHTTSKRIKVDTESSEANASQTNGSQSSVASDTNNDDSSNICVLKKKKEQENSASFVQTGATFWDENWRQTLCTCEDCISLYKENNCLYLMDAKDTVHYYESENRQNDARCSSSSSIERGMEAFGHMPRPQQIEMLHSYNDLQTALKDYLKTFAEQNKVVTKEDITRFFDDFKSRSSKITPAHLISNCR